MRKDKLTRRVREAYSQDQLARICTLREDRFGRAFGMQTVKVDVPHWTRQYSGRPEDYYHFRDNGGRVLAVAHLDTVVAGDRRTPRFRATEKGPLIVSGALDDRLGAYVIIDLLPKMGITCDWLFTVGEESGASTAEFFETARAYDHVIEFDRMGTDVVMYQYEDRASRRLVEAAGAQMGHGSFSDIAYLDQLKTKAFNWGVGYRGDYHSERGYAYLNDTFGMVAKYLRFHEQNAGVAMPHEEPSYSSRTYVSGWKADYGNCDSCGEEDVVDTTTWYCTFCGVCADCGGTNPALVAEWNDPDVEACMCYLPEHVVRNAKLGSDGNWHLDDDGNCTDCGKDTDACVCYSAEADAALAAAIERDFPGDRKIRGGTSWTPGGGVSWEAYLEKRYGKGSSARRTLDKPARLDDWHAEHYCEGCDTCASMALGKHVIPAHSEDSPVRACKLCEDAFQDTHPGWHEAAKGAIGDPDAFVGAHVPSKGWAGTCLRCAARWPAIEAPARIAEIGRLAPAVPADGLAARETARRQAVLDAGGTLYGEAS